MDFLSSISVDLSELFLSYTDTGQPHIDWFKVLPIATISIVTYGIVIIRKIQAAHNDISKDKAEISLYNSLKEQINFLNKQVKEQSDTLKVATQQKDELYKEVTELRFKTNLLQEEILSLKNVQSENQILKNKHYDKDLEIKYLRDKHEEMVNVLVKELKVIKQETLLSE